MKSDSKALYLFDIDGTLVDMMPVHVKAYQAAYRKVLGFTPEAKVLLRQFGNVERKIHEKVFSHYKIRDKRKINVIIKEYTKSVVAAIKSTKIKVLPGAKQLLRQLRNSRQPLGVVTGNSRAIGKAILKKAKLHDCFSIYSYGAVNKRAHIVRKAIGMARRNKLKFEKVVVVGDSPFDIHAARENKVVAVAVATGKYSYGELKKENPDVLLRTLKNSKLTLLQA